MARPVDHLALPLSLSSAAEDMKPSVSSNDTVKLSEALPLGNKGPRQRRQSSIPTLIRVARKDTESRSPRKMSPTQKKEHSAKGKASARHQAKGPRKSARVSPRRARGRRSPSPLRRRSPSPLLRRWSISKAEGEEKVAGIASSPKVSIFRRAKVKHVSVAGQPKCERKAKADERRGSIEARQDPSQTSIVLSRCSDGKEKDSTSLERNKTGGDTDDAVQVLETSKQKSEDGRPPSIATPLEEILEIEQQKGKEAAVSKGEEKNSSIAVLDISAPRPPSDGLQATGPSAPHSSLASGPLSPTVIDARSPETLSPVSHLATSSSSVSAPDPESAYGVFLDQVKERFRTTLSPTVETGSDTASPESQSKLSGGQEEIIRDAVQLVVNEKRETGEDEGQESPYLYEDELNPLSPSSWLRGFSFSHNGVHNSLRTRRGKESTGEEKKNAMSRYSERYSRLMSPPSDYENRLSLLKRIEILQVTLRDTFAELDEGEKERSALLLSREELSKQIAALLTSREAEERQKASLYHTLERLSGQHETVVRERDSLLEQSSSVFLRQSTALTSLELRCRELEEENRNLSSEREELRARNSLLERAQYQELTVRMMERSLRELEVQRRELQGELEKLRRKEKERFVLERSVEDAEKKSETLQKTLLLVKEKYLIAERKLAIKITAWTSQINSLRSRAEAAEAEWQALLEKVRERDELLSQEKKERMEVTKKLRESELRILELQEIYGTQDGVDSPSSVSIDLPAIDLDVIEKEESAKDEGDHGKDVSMISPTEKREKEELVKKTARVMRTRFAELRRLWARESMEEMERMRREAEERVRLAEERATNLARRLLEQQKRAKKGLVHISRTHMDGSTEVDRGEIVLHKEEIDGLEREIPDGFQREGSQGKQESCGPADLSFSTTEELQEALVGSNRRHEIAYKFWRQQTGARLLVSLAKQAQRRKLLLALSTWTQATAMARADKVMSVAWNHAERLSSGLLLRLCLRSYWRRRQWAAWSHWRMETAGRRAAAAQQLGYKLMDQSSGIQKLLYVTRRVQKTALWKRFKIWQQCTLGDMSCEGEAERKLPKEVKALRKELLSLHYELGVVKGEAWRWKRKALLNLSRSSEAQEDEPSSENDTQSAISAEVA